MEKIRIGQLLVDGGYITESQLDTALQVQKENAGSGKKLGDILVELNMVSEHDQLQALQRALNVPMIDLHSQPIQIEAVRLVPEETARKHLLVPIKEENGTLTVATNNPLDYYAFDELSMITGMDVVPVLAGKKDIEIAIQKYYAQFSVDSAIEQVNQEFDLNELQNLRAEEYNDMLDRVENAPVVRLVNSIMAQAYRMRASDIHIEPRRDDVRVRFRIDGELIEALILNSTVHVSLVTRLKIMADIDIAERRVPQDGRFAVDMDGKSLNVRMSTLPTIYGEKVVIRLLGDNTVSVMRIEELGVSAFNRRLLDSLMRSPSGIILVTGPTGSGKSTTIYAMLSELSKPNVNIITVEDPVEKVIPNLNQVQVNPKAGLDFASGLRSILRQDPDIIMIGEIRDVETASIASRAAITGHLVFSTVHTNDAASTFLRLIDMGVEPYIVASSVVGVVSQRLVKKICPFCREEDHPGEEQLSFWEGEKPAHFYHGRGCVRCNFTGYIGRCSIHEIIRMDAGLSRLIMEHASSQDIRDHVKHKGGQFLKDNLMELVRNGVTTQEELVRITYGLESIAE